jgi:transketolase
MGLTAIDNLCINTIRFLAIDAVQKANSGHSGAPLGQAPMAYVLWDRFLKHNPQDVDWPDRDRFVLSVGHLSAMLYPLLYLTGYDISMDDIRQFRQWGSKAGGHPEYKVTPGVEVTTGPLGQGFAMAVGMAMAERRMAACYNRPGYEIFNHFTYIIESDGGMMEGITSEAASLAGTLRLGKLICLYDDNDITIEGNTDTAFAENVGQRFEAYGWQVIRIDGMDTVSVDKAIKMAQSDNNHPTLIICKTIIAYGSPNKQGSASTHGNPLGEDEIRLTKENLGWPYKDAFAVPQEVLKHCRQALERGKKQQQEWEQKLSAYREKYPQEAEQLDKDLRQELPQGWDSALYSLFKDDNSAIATRKASWHIINEIAKKVNFFMGGSADLAPSVNTRLEGYGDFGFQDYSGRNIHFGIREHAMGAIANGLARHGGILPFTSTFFTFSDYMRPSVRMAALMGLHVIFIFSHDSIAVGEDGPTHEPVEHLMGFRAMPNLVTIRPADATETVEAWKVAIENWESPTALIFSRQDLPILDRRKLASASNLRRGGYVIWEAAKVPDVIIIGTGSEVHLALNAGYLLQEKGVKARVVSLPSWELFDAQPEDYRSKILPPDMRMRVSVEAGTAIGWERYVGLDGITIGLSSFGATGKGEVVYEKYGFNVQRVVDDALQLLHKQ